MIAGPDPNIEDAGLQRPPRFESIARRISSGPAAKFPYQADRGYAAGFAARRLSRPARENGHPERASSSRRRSGSGQCVVLDAIAQERRQQGKAVVSIDDATTDKEIEGDGSGRHSRLPGRHFSRVSAARRIFARETGRRSHQRRSTGRSISISRAADDRSAVATRWRRCRLRHRPHGRGSRRRRGIDQPPFKALLALAGRDQKCWITMAPSACRRPSPADTIPSRAR